MKRILIQKIIYLAVTTLILGMGIGFYLGAINANKIAAKNGYGCKGGSKK